MHCHRFSWRCFYISVLLLFLWCPGIAESSSLHLQFCPAATLCSRATLGLNSTLSDLFDCLGKLLFEQPHSKWNENQIWLHHDCGSTLLYHFYFFIFVLFVHFNKVVVIVCLLLFQV
jgi:hypothetical protein